MEVICASCGKITKDAKGSLKHPYCKECFKKEFNDDNDKYQTFLMEEHE